MCPSKVLYATDFELETTNFEWCHDRSVDLGFRCRRRSLLGNPGRHQRVFQRHNSDDASSFTHLQYFSGFINEERWLGALWVVGLDYAIDTGNQTKDYFYGKSSIFLISVSVRDVFGFGGILRNGFIRSIVSYCRYRMYISRDSNSSRLIWA